MDHSLCDATRMIRMLDGLMAWLMRPRVRRVRRWSFVITLPVALVVGHVVGLEQGALVLAIRIALWGAVAVAAWRLRGERGEVLRDVLMHPRGRAFARAEFDVLTALPRLLAGRLRRRPPAGAAYHRGTFGFALGMALTPVVLAEAVVLHLLLGGGALAWVQTALHGYMLLWLWGFALGARAFPHRIGSRAAVLRSGPMYRAAVPLSAIVRATARTERVGDRGLHERDGAVLLAARGRVDVWIELSEPVRVQRPLHEPLTTRRIAVASDEPDVLAAHLLSGARAGASRAAGPSRFEGLLVLDVAGLVRDAAQPA